MTEGEEGGEEDEKGWRGNLAKGGICYELSYGVLHEQALSKCLVQSFSLHIML